MSIKCLFDAIECRGDVGRPVAALVLPISNRPRVTSSCAGKIGLREPGEHTSGPNLASRDVEFLSTFDRGNKPTRSCATTCPSFACRTTIFRRDFPSLQSTSTSPANHGNCPIHPLTAFQALISNDAACFIAILIETAYTEPVH